MAIKDRAGKIETMVKTLKAKIDRPEFNQQTNHPPPSWCNKSNSKPEPGEQNIVPDKLSNNDDEDKQDGMYP